MIKNKYLIEALALQEAAKLTPEEKMDAWHNGQRRENIKACSDKKLIDYFDICYSYGYIKEKNIIGDELEKRGYSFEPLSLSWGKKHIKSTSSSSSTTTNNVHINSIIPENKLFAKKIGGDNIIILLNDKGNSIINNILTSSEIEENIMKNGFFENITGDFIQISKNMPKSNLIAKALLIELQKEKK